MTTKKPDMPDEIWVNEGKIVDPMKVGTCAKYVFAGNCYNSNPVDSVAVGKVREALDYGHLCYCDQCDAGEECVPCESRKEALAILDTLPQVVGDLERLASNVILSWKRGDITTQGTALLELENHLSTPTHVSQAAGDDVREAIKRHKETTQIYITDDGVKGREPAQDRREVSEDDVYSVLKEYFCATKGNMKDAAKALRAKFVILGRG